MADVFLDAGGKAYKRVAFDQVSLGLVMSLSLGGASSVTASYTGSAPASSPLSGDMDELHLKTNVANAFSLSGVRFSRDGVNYVVKADGAVQVNPSPITGIGTQVGEMTAAQGEVVLTSWTAGGSPNVTNWRGVAAAPINGSSTPFATYAMTFRVPTAPIRTGSLSILGNMQDGTTFNVTADSDGVINATRIKGRVNYTTGVVRIVGVTPSAPAGQDPVDISFLGISGVTNVYIDLIRQETVRFNAVAFTYLPLDADLLGIDPVRLPSDGRVPIFRPGGFYVIGYKDTTAPATAANAGVVDTGQTRLSRVRVIGNDDETIVDGYAADLEAGTVTWVDVTGYAQPVRVEWRYEDMSQIRDAQINGEITGLRALTHDYPVPGSYISSALVVNDLRARTQLVFDQATWDNTTFSDVLVGSASPGTFNDTTYPIVVNNRGAVTERWVLKFKSTLTFDIIGEHVGNIGEGSISTVTAPINPVTGEPYFTVPILGWGSGWSTGNILRVNTIGAMVPFWLARTIKQGPEAGEDYNFTTLVRGNIDNPL